MNNFIVIAGLVNNCNTRKIIYFTGGDEEAARSFACTALNFTKPVGHISNMTLHLYKDEVWFMDVWSVNHSVIVLDQENYNGKK